MLHQSHCHTCKSELTPNNKYLDHCHVTGKVRRYSCNICNLNFKFKDYVPIILHNLSNFDAHLILAGLDNIKDDI